MLKITEIFMKKGQELLEYFAFKNYGKQYEELSEEEKNKLRGHRVKAICSIVLNNFIKIEDLMIIQSDDRMFLSMPMKKIAEGKYKEFAHPATVEYREYINEKIMTLYNSDSNYYCDSENIENMEVTDIKIRKVNSETDLKAVCSVVINYVFVLQDIKIVQRENRLIIIKALKKEKDGKYQSIYELRKNENEIVNKLILDKYNQDINNIE